MDRLCGGTFFTLLCEAKRRGGRQTEFLEEPIKLSEPGMLEGLLRLTNRDYKMIGDTTMKTMTSRFKSCKAGTSSAIPLYDCAFVHTYHTKVQTALSAAVTEMREYVKVFLQAENSDKLLWLACALIRLVQADVHVADEALLYVLEDGRWVGKRELLEVEEVSLPVLLTCLWDYIVVNVQDNSAGGDTISTWIGEKSIVNTIGTIPDALGAPIGLVQIATVDFKLPKGGHVPVEDAAGDASNKTEGEGRCTRQISMPAAVNQPSPNLQKDAGQQQGQFAPFPSVARTFPAMNYTYNGVVFNAPAQIQNLTVPAANSNAGVNIFEMSALSADYYHLIVLDGDDLTSNVFSMPKQVIFAQNGTCDQDRKRFIAMGDNEIRQLLSYPAIIALRNTDNRVAQPYQMALLGRLTEIRIQHNDVRLKWKMYCMFPQTLLNQNEAAFHIYYCTLCNELDDEHWAIKPYPLLELLRNHGIDPYQAAVGMQPYSPLTYGMQLPGMDGIPVVGQAG